ncbi:UvrD-helicase domain-containing protein [Gaoshiqia sediminis]|uniref:DNA 3'-5' helicase n=1 Tax=Gaoshiqia sediminis TaxID=2986998 RepID=A0AA41Y520_9BACT|nr:UvrD-helicase domain-containing protein [Gaoshiqia sediminis]MCW0483569.1 UvrD-helicase domain-containing protein [Gaoshiqia sediminis]
MSQLRIYKASAGSGKTFRLAVEYLKIALAGEWNYKHILAVTFTNKATTEMKYRVVQELFQLAQGNQTAYLQVLKDETGLNETELTHRAQKCLKRILHDYSRFSISTIDSFFQRVIKAFNRELGINTAYQVDLDEDQILDEAVDELLLSIDDDRDLLEWLKQFARDKIQEGGGWNLKGDILKLGKQIYNETFKELNQALHEKLNDRAFIRNYRRDLQQIIVQYENKLKQIGKEGVRLMETAGLTAADFKYGNSGAAASFQKMLKADFSPGVRVLQAAEEAANLFKKNDPAPVQDVARQLHLLLAEVVTFYQQEIQPYNTARLIVNQLYTLGILVDLQAMVRKVTREKGVIQLSESGNLLKQIIADSETPFVYEKTGVYYQHFMIDEFQDTSGLQWNNFRPLIGNSLAENNLGMLVGDVKQAIYRWRSGDWNLLASKVSKAFPANGATEETLNKNWRSSGNVIRFNNRIFQLVPDVLQKHFNGELEDAGRAELPMEDRIVQIYRESLQEVGQASGDKDGYIRMNFYEKGGDEVDEVKQSLLDDLVTQIKRVQDLGASANEIAILVRKKDEAKLIADCLLAEKAKMEEPYNFNVLSSESLYVKNAASVAFVLSLLALLIDPDDELALAFANYQYHREIEPQLKAMGKHPQLKPAADMEQLRMDFRSPYSPDISRQFEAIEDDQNELFLFLKSDYFNDTLGSRNLQEVIFKLCEIFYLFDLKEELAYMQAFIDQVSVFLKNRTADISTFLKWWDDQGQKKTIAVSEDLDAIRIQTIHKAKGLEYNYVFVPFCDWSLEISAQHAPILWCRPDTAPFDQLELVPVKYAKNMGESLFYQEYFVEKMSNYIDNLNLLYVAFTRARQALFTWSGYGKKLGSVGDLLKAAVSLDEHLPAGGQQHLLLNLSANFDEEDQLLEIGELTIVPSKKKDTDRAIRLQDFRFADFSNYLQLRKNHEHFFEPDGVAEKNINQGRLIHEILAKITTANELEKAVNDLVFKGMLNNNGAEQIKQQLARLLTDPAVKSWFDGSYRVMNERNILTGKRGLKRPDRIMLAEGQVVVVDYKSGEQELDKYEHQVRQYMRELQACDYPNVSGYIWYTRTNKRVRIELEGEKN